jgi:hypothetical protein
MNFTLTIPMEPPSGNQSYDAKLRYKHSHELKYAKDPVTGCWVWNAALHPTGYPMSSQAEEQYAHRLSYKIYKGPIPEGKTLDHLCRNRSCINPAHLEAVSLAENVRRSPRCKLTNADVVSIRGRIDRGEVSNKAIAKDFGVTRQAIYRIRKGLMWKI